MKGESTRKVYIKGLKNSGINILEKAGKLFPDNDIDMVSNLILKQLLIFSCCDISYHTQTLQTR